MIHLLTTVGESPVPNRISMYEEVSVKTVTFQVPAMYGDHHVVEVRRILAAIPGVQDIYASSAYRVVQVTFDESQTNDLDLQVRLDDAGYMGEWSVSTETGKAVGSGEGVSPFMRHTITYELVRQTVSFSQTVAPQGRPLWPCPGMGVIKGMDEE
jgi:copper chaperone CopZ